MNRKELKIHRRRPGDYKPENRGFKLNIPIDIKEDLNYENPTPSSSKFDESNNRTIKDEKDLRYEKNLKLYESLKHRNARRNRENDTDTSKTQCKSFARKRDKKPIFIKKEIKEQKKVKLSDNNLSLKSPEDLPHMLKKAKYEIIVDLGCSTLIENNVAKSTSILPSLRESDKLIYETNLKKFELILKNRKNFLKLKKGICVNKKMLCESEKVNNLKKELNAVIKSEFIFNGSACGSVKNFVKKEMSNIDEMEQNGNLTSKEVDQKQQLDSVKLDNLNGAKYQENLKIFETFMSRHVLNKSNSNSFTNNNAAIKCKENSLKNCKIVFNHDLKKEKEASEIDMENLENKKKKLQENLKETALKGLILKETIAVYQENSKMFGNTLQKIQAKSINDVKKNFFGVGPRVEKDHLYNISNFSKGMHRKI
ncbi:hypothetical protein HDU92_008513 [Lobulomyces angularis]|nr:hypothetical protein HDU92_008513 [Lobulomyces angularis]